MYSATENDVLVSMKEYEIININRCQNILGRIYTVYKYMYVEKHYVCYVYK